MTILKAIHHSLLTALTMICLLLLAHRMQAETIKWTGFYGGGFLGGSTGTTVTTSEPVRLDNNAYWFRPYHNSTSYKAGASLLGGVTLGYNWQIPRSPWLLGLEGEYGYLNVAGSSSDSNQGSYTALPGNSLVEQSRSNASIGNTYGYALLGGRAGYTYGRFLFYIKSGFLLTQEQGSYHSVKTEDQSPAYLNLTGSKEVTSFGIGGGVEYALPVCSRLTLKVEYLFLDTQSSLTEAGDCSCHFRWNSDMQFGGINTFKVGLNYHF